MKFEMDNHEITTIAQSEQISALANMVMSAPDSVAGQMLVAAFAGIHGVELSTCCGCCCRDASDEDNGCESTCGDNPDDGDDESAFADDESEDLPDNPFGDPDDSDLPGTPSAPVCGPTPGTPSKDSDQTANQCNGNPDSGKIVPGQEPCGESSENPAGTQPEKPSDEDAVPEACKMAYVPESQSTEKPRDHARDYILGLEALLNIEDEFVRDTVRNASDEDKNRMLWYLRAYLALTPDERAIYSDHP